MTALSIIQRETTEKPSPAERSGIYSQKLYALYKNQTGNTVMLGRSLAEAKAEMGPGEFKAFCESDACPVSYSVASRLMTISATPHLADPDNWSRLSTSWNVQYEMALLAPLQFEAALRERKITRDSTIDDIRRIAGKKRHSASRGKEPAKTTNAGAQPQDDTAEIVQIAELLSKPPTEKFHIDAKDAVVTSSVTKTDGATEARVYEGSPRRVDVGIIGDQHKFMIFFRCDSLDEINRFSDKLAELLATLAFEECRLVRV